MVGGPDMKVSNPDRIVYPEAGWTKSAVVSYYATVADAMLPHMGGAPLTLERYPKGIGGDGFMQKNAPKHYPSSIERYEVPRKGGSTLFGVIHDADDITYLANQGTLTFHAWTSRTTHIGTPDRVVIDLDPLEDSAAMAREAALVVRAALDALGLPSAPVATGSKGYHVVVPVDPVVPFDRIASFTQGFAALLCADRPDLLTQEFRIENRKGRVFVDWLRNTPGATTVVPWSLRARPGAPAAVPITWEEMASTDPGHWRLDTAPGRLGRGDPLLPLIDSAPSADTAVSAVGDILENRGITLERFNRFRS